MHSIYSYINVAFYSFVYVFIASINTGVCGVPLIAYKTSISLLTAIYLTGFSSFITTSFPYFDFPLKTYENAPWPIFSPLM